MGWNGVARTGDAPAKHKLVAVHIAARISAEAAAAEMLTSGTVKDLVVGSGPSFVERGSRSLKGVEGEWRLFAAT
jgi:class 3 adenylate cyclase